MSHIIGRPGDDLLDVMLGAGDPAEPEQAFIRSSEQVREKDDGAEARPPEDEPGDHA